MMGQVRARAVIAIILASIAGLQGTGPDGQEQQESSFRFKSGVELVNVTATVSDSSGRFVPGLGQDDFIVYEDGRPQSIAHFSADRAPVSLGIAVDTSGSMAGDKILAARTALGRFLGELLDPQDEMFVYRFSDAPELLQEWTTDRQLLSRALRRMSANGGTAMYDTIAEAIPVAGRGQHLKKALVVISDGNDTSSRVNVPDLRQRIRESEVLVYAVGIDGESDVGPRQPPLPRPRPWPIPLPIPRGRGGWPQPQPPTGGTGGGAQSAQRADQRVNVAALRALTDDSGGRTEIIRDAEDLDPATANIADELSRQYYIGYPASGVKDGRWHEIRVEVRNSKYRVRARRGYFAT
jgi:Ca-activated chloride channel family protein